MANSVNILGCVQCSEHTALSGTAVVVVYTLRLGILAHYTLRYWGVLRALGAIYTYQKSDE